MSISGNRRQAHSATISAAVDLALFIHDHQRTAFGQIGIDPRGLSILELGPGTDFGPALMLASMGARVTLADRYLAAWEPDFHPAYYRQLAEAWGQPADQIIAAADGYENTSLTLLSEGAENLAAIPDDSVDFVFSHTVLEHIQDMTTVAAEMWRVMKPGGCAVHVIDWADHRNMSRPLTHLLMPDEHFFAAADDALWEFGNRYRPSAIPEFPQPADR